LVFERRKGARGVRINPAVAGRQQTEDVRSRGCVGGRAGAKMHAPSDATPGTLNAGHLECIVVATIEIERVPVQVQHVQQAAQVVVSVTDARDAIHSQRGTGGGRDAAIPEVWDAAKRYAIIPTGAPID